MRNEGDININRMSSEYVTNLEKFVLFSLSIVTNAFIDV